MDCAFSSMTWRSLGSVLNAVFSLAADVLKANGKSGLFFSIVGGRFEERDQYAHLHQKLLLHQEGQKTWGTSIAVGTRTSKNFGGVLGLACYASVVILVRRLRIGERGGVMTSVVAMLRGPGFLFALFG